MYEVYLITHDEGVNFLNVIEEACQSGVTMVQLREKTLSTHDFYEKAKKVKEITDKYRIPLIINDRIDICMAINADGVHIGDDELPVDVVRKLLPDKILGVSAKTVERALEAEKQGADYLGVGAVYPSKTKDADYITIDTLQKVVNAVLIPSVAIGGLTLENIDTLKGLGIRGAAISRDIMKAENVLEHVKKLRDKAEEIFNG